MVAKKVQKGCPRFFHALLSVLRSFLHSPNPSRPPNVSMTATMDAAVSTGSNNDARADEQVQDMQREILPDSIVELLRRMAEEIKCSIWYVNHDALCPLLERTQVHLRGILTVDYPIRDAHTTFSFDVEYSLGTMDQPKVTPCNHTFCDECIRQALIRREECPLCKNRFSKRSLNSVEHLEKVISAFHNLTAAYALEYGQCKSSVPCFDP